MYGMDEENYEGEKIEVLKQLVDKMYSLMMDDGQESGMMDEAEEVADDAEEAVDVMEEVAEAATGEGEEEMPDELGVKDFMQNGPERHIKPGGGAVTVMEIGMSKPKSKKKRSRSRKKA